MTTVLIGAYLSAIVAANLLAAYLGPWVTPFNAFVLIAFDLTSRDALHERFRHQGLWLKMGALIVAGGFISFIVNPAAGRIALASCLAFTVAGSVNATAYWLLDRWPRLLKMNASNLPAATADSIIFPTVAFGAFLPAVIATHIIVKVSGGALWSLLLVRVSRATAR